MTFEENPLNILNLSIYDDRETIIRRANYLLFTNPAYEKNINIARDILLNPQTRVAAELNFFAHAQLFNDKYILNELERVDEKFSTLNINDLLVKINEARARAGFPALQDINAISQELSNVRSAIREKIQRDITKIPYESYIQLSGGLSERIFRKGHFGSVVEDFFVSYNFNMRPFLADKQGKIHATLETIKTEGPTFFSNKNFKTLEAELKSFCELVTPLNKFFLVKGVHEYPDTVALLNLFVDYAVNLHNEAERTQEAIYILTLFEKYFSYVPEIKDAVNVYITKLQTAFSGVFEFLYTVPPFKNIMQFESLPRWARSLICLPLAFVSFFGLLFCFVKIAEFNSHLGLGVVVAFIGFMLYKFRSVTIRIFVGIIILILLLIIKMLFHEFMN